MKLIYIILFLIIYNFAYSQTNVGTKTDFILYKKFTKFETKNGLKFSLLTNKNNQLQAKGGSALIIGGLGMVVYSSIDAIINNRKITNNNFYIPFSCGIVLVSVPIIINRKR